MEMTWGEEIIAMVCDADYRVTDMQINNVARDSVFVDTNGHARLFSGVGPRLDSLPGGSF